MISRLLFIIACISVSLASCKRKCTLNCQCIVGLYAHGFYFHDLDTVIFKKYAPGGSFSTFIDSLVIMPTAQPWWYPLNSDTTKKEYKFVYKIGRNSSGYNLRDYITGENDTLDDLEVIFPLCNRKYRVSAIKIEGPATDEIECKDGVVSRFASCGTYQSIVSYTIDGTQVVFAQYSNMGLIYIDK